MQEVFEKTLERLEEELELSDKEKERCVKENHLQFDSAKGYANGVAIAIEIVKQEAEQYNNGWTLCSEDNKNLPADCERVRVTLWSGDEFTGYRKDGKWFIHGGNGIAEADVIAWQPIQPYRPTRESCSNRHENGNCLAVGGFCTSVDDKYCKYHKKKTNFDRCCESMEAMAQVIDIAKVGWTKEQIMEWLQSEVEE